MRKYTAKDAWVSSVPTDSHAICLGWSAPVPGRSDELRQRILKARHRLDGSKVAAPGDGRTPICSLTSAEFLGCAVC